MSTLLDQASLVMIPSGYKEDVVYCPKPTNGNGDLTFTRATAATRVNADGLIEKERGNLWLQSNSFDTTWAANNSSVTSGQSGYDGTNDAWLFTETDVNGNLTQTISGLNGVFTLSVYAKAGSVDFLRINASGIGSVYFDVSNGTLGISSAAVKTTITSAGNGYYRCSATYNGTPSTLRFYPAEADGSDLGTSGSIYIQDAQAEYGLVATDYIETTTSAVYSGITANIPRLDYSQGSCPALLLEPQRTNIAPYSEDHSAATYGNNYVTIVANDVISPDGTQNADKIVLDSGTNTSNGGHYFIYSSTAGTSYTISVFAKKGEYRYFTFTYGSGSSGGGHFDLQEGTLLGTITNAQYTNVNASIEDYQNGWYRLVVSLTETVSTPGRFLSMKPSPSATVPSNNNYSSTGDGTSGAYIYGFQVEVGSYVTSYIPTTSTTVTRVADACYKTGISSLIGQSEGTLFVEIERKQFDTQAFWVNISDNSYNNWIFIGWDGYNNRNYIRVGNVVYADGGIGNMPVGTYKIAIAYKSGDSVSYVNGVQAWADSDTWTLSGLNTLNVGGAQPVAGGMLSLGSINQALLFKTRLTNAELATLTTL